MLNKSLGSPFLNVAILMRLTRWKIVALLLLAISAWVTFTIRTLQVENALTDSGLQSLLAQYFADDVEDVTTHYIQSSPHTLGSKFALERDTRFKGEFQKFYGDILDVMKAQQLPKITIGNRPKGETKSELLSYCQLDDTQLEEATDLHSEVFEGLPRSAPRKLYNGEGIVLVGGGKYSWLSLLSIKSMRSAGSVLPIEVFIPEKKDYEYQFCEVVLPTVDARCVKLWEIVDFKLKRFQYKALAILASSFESIFLFDSDNILVSNPDDFFHSEVFEKYGMVTWPDYWKRATSPLFYELSGQQVNETAQVRSGIWDLGEPRLIDDVESVPFHSLEGTVPGLSSESGQLLINKMSHIKTIILSAYYNIHGPDFFYPMISQGSLGEGDKDTFVTAAVRAEEPFYQVRSELQPLGTRDIKGSFHPAAMGQKNPIDDYAQIKVLEQGNGTNLERWGKFDRQKARLFAVHANSPKLDPEFLMRENSLISDGKEVRLYSDARMFFTHVDGGKEGEKFDFEKTQFRRMKYLLCDLRLEFKHFNMAKRDKTCSFIQGHLDVLKSINNR